MRVQDEEFKTMIYDLMNGHYDLDKFDCEENEKRFIYELIKASLETMHKNGWELASSDRHR